MEIIQKKDFYELMFNRDFCLVNIEVWCRGESTEARQWTVKQQPIKPYIIFERNNDRVYCYMCKKGIDWIKEELISLIKKDKDYTKKAIEIFNNKNKDIKSFIHERKIFDHKNLIKFIKEHLDSWPWFEATWYLLELYDEKYPDSEELELLKKARVETEDFGVGFDNILLDSLKKIFPDLGELVSVLTIGEIESKKIPPVNILKKRLSHYIYTDSKLFLEETIEDIEKKYNIELERVKKIDMKNGLKGQIAFKGYAKGIVKKISRKSDLYSIKDRDVLVTPMTMPDYVPFLKKASAIITDEGGVTCHAAIVSRELGIPCIIGTKIATKVLHDGDLVEVDADKGVVKIVERKN